MLIRIDKHPQLLGAIWLASTLAAASAAAVTELGPTPQVPDPDVDAATEMHLDAPIPFRGRQCLGFFIGRPPPCSSCGGGTPSCGATMRSQPGSFVTAEAYLPWIAARMVVTTT